MGVDSFQLSVNDMKYAGKSSADLGAAVIVNGDPDRPLKLHVDTDTDWATVAPSAAGVIVALIVAWLTVRVQRNQISSNLSNFRHQWMVELRLCVAEYLQSIVTRSVKNQNDKEWLGSSEDFELYRRIMVLTVQFELLLSRDDEVTSVIFELDNRIMKMLYGLSPGDSSTPIIELVNQLKDLLRRELEKAWIDVQRDVGKVNRLSGARPGKNVQPPKPPLQAPPSDISVSGK